MELTPFELLSQDPNPMLSPQTQTYPAKPGTINNGAFSVLVPNLQIAWDSTSLGVLKECPRKYEYSILEGLAPSRESVHLTFGKIYHSALETYDKERSQGVTHAAAIRGALHRVLYDSWDFETKRPWWSDDANKNRETLVRTVLWYLDQFADDPLSTVQLANGQPAVELSFRWQTDYATRDGELYILCGHLDRIATMGEQTFIVDRKTSKHTLSADFFTKWSPDNQFSMYSLAAKVVYSRPVAGIIVDAAQVAVTFSRFGRGIVPRADAQLEEWYQDLSWWLSSAESYARANYWPQNDKSCGLYGGCPFRDVCAKSPATRAQWIAASYVRRVWDPLQVRGDV